MSARAVRTFTRVALAAALVGCRRAPTSPMPAPVHGDDRGARTPAVVDAARRSDEPKTDAASDGLLSAPIPDAGPPAATKFVPVDVGPMRPGSSHPGRATDGVWTAVTLDGDVGPPLLWKTVIHPDKARPSTELFVVAIDVARVRIDSVAGAVDPAPEVPSAKNVARPAVIPADRHDGLVAAFNGGWKGEHGHFGIKVDGVVLVKPLDGSCTIAAYDDDTLRIAPWKELAVTEPQMRLFRQTPACMVSNGTRHPALAVENTTSWGAAADGDAVIRRSAVALGKLGTTLFVAVSNPMTAPAIADGLRHVGAEDVAELDVNWSFPKFLLFRKNAAGVLEAESLFAGFVFDKNEYVRQRAARDFFYLTRR